MNDGDNESIPLKFSINGRRILKRINNQDVKLTIKEILAYTLDIIKVICVGITAGVFVKEIDDSRQPSLFAIGMFILGFITACSTYFVYILVDRGIIRRRWITYILLVINRYFNRLGQMSFASFIGFTIGTELEKNNPKISIPLFCIALAMVFVLLDLVLEYYNLENTVLIAKYSRISTPVEEDYELNEIEY